MCLNPLIRVIHFYLDIKIPFNRENFVSIPSFGSFISMRKLFKEFAEDLFGLNPLIRVIHFYKKKLTVKKINILESLNPLIRVIHFYQIMQEEIEKKEEMVSIPSFGSFISIKEGKIQPSSKINVSIPSFGSFISIKIMFVRFAGKQMSQSPHSGHSFL